MSNTSLVHKIGLSLFPRIGSVNARRLVAYLGSVNAVFEASKSELRNIPGFSDGLTKIVVNHKTEVLEKAQRELEFIEKYKIKTYFYLDHEFPRRLAQCDDAPVILFLKGDVDLNQQKIISVVGTRNASDYGRQLTNDLISGLTKIGVTALIVSGLAYGIDVTAHKASLKAGLPTLGVIGHGLDKMYPAAHASIAKEMLANKGALLTDFTSGSKIDPGNFLRRNRIVAGLADCTIVVESATKGGAMVTADIACSYNRDVFAFPGSVYDINSSGCNWLIKKNSAALIESSEDLVELMGWKASQKPTQASLFIEFSDKEQLILKFMQQNELTTTDLIARELNMTVQQINTLMLNLEFNGVIKALPGNRFKIKNKLAI